jgi:hypothetical protein
MSGGKVPRNETGAKSKESAGAYVPKRKHQERGRQKHGWGLQIRQTNHMEPLSRPFAGDISPGLPRRQQQRTDGQKCTPAHPLSPQTTSMTRRGIENPAQKATRKQGTTEWKKEESRRPHLPLHVVPVSVEGLDDLSQLADLRRGLVQLPLEVRLLVLQAGDVLPGDPLGS